MSEDKESSGAGGPNWMLGIDKLTTPTLEFLGTKLRDSVRSYLNSKARERAAVRKFEREFFVRQSELLYYGADQFALGLPALEAELLDRAFVRFEALAKKIADEKSVEPMRVLEVVTQGVLHQEALLATSQEVALYHATASILDVLVANYSAQAIFHFCFVPSTVHCQDPQATDDALDAVMADPETLSQIQDEIEVPDHELGLRIAKTISGIYGVEWRDIEKKG